MAVAEDLQSASYALYDVTCTHRPLGHHMHCQPPVTSLALSAKEPEAHCSQFLFEGGTAI